MSAPVGILFRW